MSDDYNAQYRKIEHSHSHVDPADERLHFEDFARAVGKSDIWEETALGVVGEAGEYDVLLWAAGYVLSGEGQGIWGRGNTAEREIQLIVVPRSQRGAMDDNDFVRVGWTPTERLEFGELKIEDVEDGSIWDFKGLRFSAKPPVWRLEGEAGGARFDLEYAQIGTPLWNWGPFAKAPEAGRAGYDAFVKVNGTISTGKQELEIKDGYGVREHIITGQSNDPIKNLMPPNWMWWLYTIDGDVKINFFQVNNDIQLGFVKFGEEGQVNVSSGSSDTRLNFEVIEKWEDPRTGLNLPVKWRLEMEADGLRVAVNIAAHGRAYSHWPLAHGTRMYCYLLSTMTGEVHLPDGRSISLNDQLTVNSFCRTILSASETSDGQAAKLPI